MSFVTTACGGAPGRGSAAPPDPCPHSGAATSAATATVADHRVQCIIPTSVKGRRLFSRTQRESHIRSEEHTSELQSPCNLVCRLLLEKKKTNTNKNKHRSYSLNTQNIQLMCVALIHTI